MLRLLGARSRLCDGLRRREMLRIGGLGLLGAGLDLRGLLAADQARAGAGSGPKAKSCIVIFLMGGPPQHSTWDPKPDAPADVRGAFKPIATKVPGMFISELLPKTAQVADKLCLIRSMSTGDNAHSSSGYYMLTGRPHAPMNFENANPGAPNDAPCFGALAGRVLTPGGSLPGTMTLPHRIFNTDGSVWPGQDAGFLGRAQDPWLLNAKLTPQGYRIQEIDLPDDLAPARVARRRDLLELVKRQADRLDPGGSVLAHDARARQAFDILASTRARGAFRLEEEPDAVRERYGKSPLGQGCLLARRLVEAGVRLVQVNWYRGPDEPPDTPCWDSHTKETARLRDVLVPPTDAALSGLIADLDARGRLDDTLVVCMSEFGRSPRLDGNGGRGHWGSAFSVALAGGGIKGGIIHGSSDKFAAQVKDARVRPEDLFATIFHCLGVDPSTEYYDPLGRRHEISRGQVVREILV